MNVWDFKLETGDAEPRYSHAVRVYSRHLEHRGGVRQYNQLQQIVLQLYPQWKEGVMSICSKLPARGEFRPHACNRMHRMGRNTFNISKPRLRYE